MSNPFDPAQGGFAEHHPDVESGDPWPLVAQILLVVIGLIYVGFGLLMLGYPFLLMLDPSLSTGEAAIMGGVFGGFGLCLCGGFGVANFAAAMGLRARSKWGWIGTIALAGIYTPSGCFPFGLLLLWAMLNDRTRKTYLGS